MAIVWLSPPKYDVTISAANAHYLPCPFPGVVCRWYIRAVETNFVGTITIKSRPAGTGDTPAAQEYTTVADEAQSSATIVDSSFWIWVDASDRDVVIDCTPYTSGSLAVTCTPVLG